MGGTVRIWCGLALLVGALLALAPAANAQSGSGLVHAAALPGGAQRLTYRIGPITITPGQNRIDYSV
ncbi:MAG TPA: hypothetical protein VI111_10340, partial [Thermoleophilaceae bacterium]